MPASPVVLDSHALLKFLRDEPGADTVSQLLERAGQRDQPVHMTEVNYAEVQYIIRRKDGDTAWATVAGALSAAPIEFHPATRCSPTSPLVSKPVSGSVSRTLSPPRWRRK